VGDQPNKADLPITPEMIGAGADVLWEWLGDGVSQSEPRSQIEETVRQILLAARTAGAERQ
jgi:hypothetical protein